MTGIRNFILKIRNLKNAIAVTVKRTLSVIE